MKEKEPECGCNETVENCDIFDFMANRVGLSVLHPGGFDSTRKLLTFCKLGKIKESTLSEGGFFNRQVAIPLRGCKIIGRKLSNGAPRNDF